MIGASLPERTPGRRTVLLTFATVSWQKGSAAQVASLVAELRKVRADLRFRLLSHCPELDEGPAGDLGIEVVDPEFREDAGRNRRSVALLWRRLLGSVAGRGLLARQTRPIGATASLAAEYANADLVLDLSGDSYRDPPGGFALAHNANLLMALRSRTPYALASQSIGPFSRPNRPLARYLLNRAELVYIRERRTQQILEKLAVRPDRIHLAPDVAFALAPGSPAEIWSAEPIEPDRLQRPWIGLSVSHLALRLSRGNGQNRYLEETVRVVEHVHRRYGATVLLVPHEINPPQYGVDDRTAAEALYERAGRPSWIVPIRGDYDPATLKGLIAECDALIASRMHAGIAGLSTGVPTVFAAWAHKYQGLMDEILLPDFVWNQNTGEPGDLVRLFDRLWDRRTLIRSHLLEYTRRAQQEIVSVVRRIARCITAPLSEVRACAARSSEIRLLP